MATGQAVQTDSVDSWLPFASHFVATLPECFRICVSDIITEDVLLDDITPGSPGMNTQISQIPGLSPGVISCPEERVRGRRHGVLESDSEYIKLAKQGGHKGLLWHEEKTAASKANSYNPPEWFCNAPVDSSTTSLFNSKEQKKLGDFQQPECPVGTDSKFTEEMDDSDDNETQDNVCKSRMEIKSPSSQYLVNIKFRRKVFDKKASPVNMSKLLSFGYAEANKVTTNKAVSN